MPDLTGRILLNRYHVREFIGRGGMADVYKVWDEKMAVHLAMKLLNDDLADDKVFIRRFKREADTLAKLQHPHIVRMYGLKEDGIYVFMLMDFIEGQSFKREIKLAGAKGLPIHRIHKVMVSICSALHFAHNQNYVHADIKPANLIVDNNQNVYLADFGIARMTDAATATMVGAGTPAYMSPEQVVGDDPSPQSDIYSFGIVLYEMLTGGDRPFIGESTTATGTTGAKIRWEHVHQHPPSVRSYNPDVTPEIDAVILRCLAKKQEDRYGTAQELLSAFEIAVGLAAPELMPDTLVDDGPTMIDPTIGMEEVEPAATIVDESDEIEFDKATIVDESEEIEIEAATIIQEPKPEEIELPGVDVPTFLAVEEEPSIDIVEEAAMVDAGAYETIAMEASKPAPKPKLKPKPKKKGPNWILIGGIGFVFIALVAIVGVILAGVLSTSTDDEKPTEVAEVIELEENQPEEDQPEAEEPTEKPFVAPDDPTEIPTKIPTEVPVKEYSDLLICQVTDVGGIDDKSFNATAWKGVTDAMGDFGVEGIYLESQQQTDYVNNLNAFIEEDCDLIIAVGFLMADAVDEASAANPEQLFATIDVNWLDSPNLRGSGFAINEATFLNGYLAAGMTETGIVGTYVGIAFPATTIFMDGYVLGVAHYNEVHGTDVRVIGWDVDTQDGLATGDFENTDDGRTMGNNLMDEGADIIMPVAGPVGLGTLAAMEERDEGLLIGVDNDWSLSNPASADYVLASAMKNMDIFIYETIKALIDGEFEAGNYLGTIENHGVDIAYGSAWVDFVPEYLLQEIAELKEGIADGSIKTLP